MTGFQFIVASLACYRVTVFVTRDLGPFKLFQRLRKLNPQFLGCPFCVSPWVAASIEALFYFSGVCDSFVVSGCVVLAMSAITIALDRTFTSDHNP